MRYTYKLSRYVLLKKSRIPSRKLDPSNPSKKKKKNYRDAFAEKEIARKSLAVSAIDADN